VANVVEEAFNAREIAVRVNAQVSRWPARRASVAQTYDRDLADVFAIQSEIAKANLPDKLQAKLSPNEKKAIEQPPTTDLAAFDLYSGAKSLLLTSGFSATARPDLREAIELLEYEAVKRDPIFTLTASSPMRGFGLIEQLMQGGLIHHSRRLAAGLKLRLQAAHGCRPDVLPKRIGRAPQYLYSGGATMPARSPNWRLCGERYQ